MRRNWPFFKVSDWLILVFVHSAKPTAELENLAMSPSLSSPGLSYDPKFVHIGWELRSSLVGDTILGVQSEPACNRWDGMTKKKKKSCCCDFVPPEDIEFHFQQAPGHRRRSIFFLFPEGITASSKQSRFDTGDALVLPLFRRPVDKCNANPELLLGVASLPSRRLLFSVELLFSFSGSSQRIPG